MITYMIYLHFLIKVLKLIFNTQILPLITMCMNILHEHTTENNVHDSTCSSMSAQSMLNLGLGKKGFKMGHLNVQGIQNKIEQIDLLLNSSGNDIHLFGLSESKLNDSHTSNFFNIKNFQLFRKDRVISAVRPEQGGGIIVYVKDGIKCERRLDLECENIECIWLEIFPKNSKSFLIGSMYRHPNHQKLFSGMKFLTINLIKY